MTDFQKARKAAIRAMADAVGYEYDTLYTGKQDYINDRGNRHDVNTPYKSDFDAGVDAALSAFEQAGFVLVMKVPSETVIHEGTQAFWANHSLADSPVGTRAMWYAYRAMITAALKERQT